MGRVTRTFRHALTITQPLNVSLVAVVVRGAAGPSLW